VFGLPQLFEFGCHSRRTPADQSRLAALIDLAVHDVLRAGIQQHNIVLGAVVVPACADEHVSISGDSPERVREQDYIRSSIFIPGFRDDTVDAGQADNLLAAAFTA
jgi:hypothetical protein